VKVSHSDHSTEPLASVKFKTWLCPGLGEVVERGVHAESVRYGKFPSLRQSNLRESPFPEGSLYI